MRRPNLRRRLVAVAALSVASAALPIAVATASAPHGPASGLTSRKSHAGQAPRTFRPRIGFAMGILPKLGTTPEIAAAPSVPVVYHGGSVMRNVTLHTIFWAPNGYRFDGSPSQGVLGYEPMVKQFLQDVAHDSDAPGNAFSTLTQYSDWHGPGSTQLSYDPAVDSVDVTDPYPPQSRQCPSPSGIAACITDLELQREIDKVAGTSSASRGLSNMWFIFLPPDVDTCTELGTCATNAFAGYHSEFDFASGPTVYVVVPDPLVEFTPSPGSDPQGNPEAESTIDTVAHEAEEAITDPYGDAWMDPNGFEVADKCETGPQNGTPLGYAPDGSPYNQVINGHQYLFQDMWSNGASGCVQTSTAPAPSTPLHAVWLHQFSSMVRGNVGVHKRIPVLVSLVRSTSIVAIATTISRPNGSWGPIQLRGAKGAPHAVGDDREGINVQYGDPTAKQPAIDVIDTGNGGNPFTESGYTGWYDLDHGFAVGSHGVLIGPCGQTGAMALQLGSLYTASPNLLCSTESDAALVSTVPIGPGTPLTFSSLDNRAPSILEPGGALVVLTIKLGEPDSVSAAGNNQLLFLPTGFPTCTAFLRIRTVRCTGLVPLARYRLGLRRARADRGGAIQVAGLRLGGGQTLTLTNRAGRRLTTLHIAHLRVDITGNQTQIASGTCQPGDFYGAPLSSPPTGQFVGDGVGGEGTVCPDSGQAKGLSTKDIAQTDDFSGGQTVIQVPTIEATAPLNDETLYGAFTASAQSGLPASHGSIGATGVPVALTVTRAASRRQVFHASNVDTRRGVHVHALAPGEYLAKWVLHDANGDTRTVMTRFDEER
jgi:hypothetical protein